MKQPLNLSSHHKKPFRNKDDFEEETPEKKKTVVVMHSSEEEEELSKSNHHKDKSFLWGWSSSAIETESHGSGSDKKLRFSDWSTIVYPFEATILKS